MREENKERKGLESRAGIGKRAANKRIASGTASEDFQASKERKEKATADLRERQAERAQVDLDKARGKLVEKSEVEEAGERLAIIEQGMWDSFESDWPTSFEGLSAPKIRELVKAERDRYFKTVRAELEKL